MSRDDQTIILARRGHREIERMTKALQAIADAAGGPMAEEARRGLALPEIEKSYPAADAWIKLLSDIKHLDASINRIAEMDPGDCDLDIGCVEAAKAARFYAGTRFKGAA